MSRLQPAKLHVRLGDGITSTDPVTPRCYTLTHSDASGDLFLTISRQYDKKQVSGWYTRLMRDEVIAEWLWVESGPELNVFCHVSGGLTFGTARWRYAIFRHELPLVLEAFRYGDRQFFVFHPALDLAPIKVHFHSHRKHYQRTENWGVPANYTP
jgi:hypothetical protein